MIFIPETHTEWLKERKRGIGASDAGTIIGVNPWKSNVQLWAEKTGQTEPEDISGKPYVQYGHDAEPHIRALFALDHPQLTVSYESPYKMICNDTYPWLFCTPDGELVDSEGNHGGLEIKTTEIMNSRQWASWNDRIPDQYYAQVCHQMLATGWQFVMLRVHIRFTTKDGDKRSEMRDYHISRDDAIEDMKALLDAEIEFWDKVQKKECPALILPNV